MDLPSVTSRAMTVDDRSTPFFSSRKIFETKMEEKQNKGEREKLAESFVMWVKNVA